MAASGEPREAKSENQPAIVAIDSDPQVREVMARVLQDYYGQHYFVWVGSTGAEGLDRLRACQEKNEPVALVSAFERLADRSGVEFLTEAANMFPHAKRVLVQNAGPEAAPPADLPIRIDACFVRLADPPQERLFPLLDDLLADWQVDAAASETGESLPPEYGIRVIGHRWSPQTHEVKDFFARNQMPVEWLDLENDDAARRLFDEKQKQVGSHEQLRVPLVIFPDDSFISDATVEKAAHQIGLSAEPSLPFYDLIIVGGGPAGLSAGVYAASEGLKTVIVEKVAPGGQAGTSSMIENYLGFPAGLSGGDLARRAVAQAQKFGVEILAPQTATRLRLKGTSRYARLTGGNEIGGHAVVLAIGVEWRRLEAPEIDRFTGAGVYYGSTLSEAQACRDEDIYIVGAANSAAQAALHFSKYARRVIMLVRGNSLDAKMSRYLVEQIQETPNIKVRLRTQVTGVSGNSHLEKITVRDENSRREEALPTTSLFLFIGATPDTGWLKDVVQLDERGYILVGNQVRRGDATPHGWQLQREPTMFETSVPGVFAIGDVQHGSVKRVASAVGEGAVVVQLIHQYLAQI